MSSGLPPILAANSATQQQTPFSNPFSHFGYLFGQQHHQHQPFVLQTPTQNTSNRLKAKRHRQRVDAGEPRNTYQGTVQKNRSTTSGHDDKIMMQIESPINSLWSTSSASSQQQKQKSPSSSSNDCDLIKSAVDDATNLSLSCIKEIAASTNTGVESEENEIEDDGILLDEYEDGTKNDEVEESEDVEEEENGAENGREESVEKEENRESPSSTSSASKRKSFMPQKIGEQLGIELADEPEQINISVGGGSSDKNREENGETEEKTPLSALQAQLTGVSTPVSNIFEAQKKIYAAFIEQQQRKIIQNQQVVQDRKVNTEQLVQTLKNEIMDTLNKSIEKILRDWAVAEMARQEAATNSSNSRPQPVPAPVAPSLPPFAHPIFPLQNPNPLAAFQLANHHPIGGGIFPPNFNAFNQLQAFNALRRNLEENNAAIQEPKKKRAKLDVAKKEEHDFSSPAPLSAPASPPISMGHHTPLNRYFPPTMVGHPLYGGVSFANDREDSPTNSDEMSDCGGYDGSGSSTTLTPMHLRKAKLMFFYKRYPDSNSLKPYFPDIRFNKNNTAQLVKWFSNFREFYYIQMEKFGRQLLAEGVKNREEIFVSKDCELFKVLNTHYNRNNHIEPPPQLLPVIQETLREFYSAIREGKDIEPSWKKTIYKVIKEMDFDIPSAFKDANYPLDS